MEEYGLKIKVTVIAEDFDDAVRIAKEKLSTFSWSEIVEVEELE